MNIETGEIIDFKSLEERLKELGNNIGKEATDDEKKKWVPVNNDIAEQIKNMNRKQIRRFYALHKGIFTK